MSGGGEGQGWGQWSGSHVDRETRNMVGGSLVNNFEEFQAVVT